MSWIKRNLYFLIGSAVALVLLGLAGFYFYSQWGRNNDNLDKLNAAYDELDRLAKETPNPGNDQVNNIEIARQQELQVRAIMDRERKYYSSITPIPNPTNNIVTKEEFASALRRTIDELTHDAGAASVTLPKDYGFSFGAERTLTIFDPGGLAPLAGKLGEVREICRVLYQAKVNSLDNLRRPRVSPDDRNGAQSDFLETAPVTNRLAVLTSFEVVFHCFSAELAGVLSSFADSPHGFVVKSLNVEPGALAQPSVAETGTGPPGGGFSGFAAPAAAAPPTKGGMPVLVDEKQLKVTLVLNLIELLPKK
jgi:hypothetical protein